MDLFVKHLDKIRSLASKQAALFNGKYEVNELVNEAYIRYDIAITNNPSLIEGKFSNVKIFLTRIKNDMKDFIRKDTELRRRQNWERAGKRYPEFHNTSFGVHRDEEEDSFDPKIYDNNNNFEIRDFLGSLFDKVKLSDTEWKIIQGYFYEEKTMKEVGKDLGYAESTIFSKTNGMCKKMLKCSNESDMW